MRHVLIVKFAVVAALSLVLMLPLLLIRDKVVERQATRERVQADIAASTAAAQRVTGPVLVYECSEPVLEEGERKLRTCPPLYLFPERLRISGNLDTEVRKRGIHAARIFRSELRLSGLVRVPEIVALPSHPQRRYSNPFLVVSVTDPRGLKGLPLASWRGESRSMEPGVGLSRLGKGIHVPLDPALAPGSAEFDLKLELQGTERLEVAPVGRDTEVSIASSWPHPSFVGRYLPDQRELGAEGFRATWRTTHFSTGDTDRWRQALSEMDKPHANTLGVAFIEPIGFYAMAYRATEYGLLFIALTFGLLFFTETTKDVRIHPMQYAFVGAALAVFYLLLIALAEHIGFAAGYSTAAAACVLLLGYYARFVFGSWWRAAGYTAWNCALYSVLYVVIGAEDYALLLGAALVFGALAGAMITTRKLDWFGLTARLSARNSVGTAPAEDARSAR